MAGLNKVILIGNVGRDPEMRYLPSGSPVTGFSIAVSRRWKSREGEDREETDWFNVSCFDRLAEIANEFVSKGKQVYVEGRVRGRLYDDQQSGEKRFSLDVNASNIVLLGQRGDAGVSSGAGEQRGYAAENTDFENMPF